MAGGLSETAANEIGYSKTVEGLDTTIKEKAKRVVKKRTSAWAKYLKSEMPKLRRKYPRTSPQELMKKASRSWKKSSKNPNRKRSRR